MIVLIHYMGIYYSNILYYGILVDTSESLKIPNGFEGISISDKTLIYSKKARVNDGIYESNIPEFIFKTRIIELNPELPGDFFEESHQIKKIFNETPAFYVICSCITVHDDIDCRIVYNLRVK